MNSAVDLLGWEYELDQNPSLELDLGCQHKFVKYQEGNYFCCLRLLLFPSTV